MERGHPLHLLLSTPILDKAGNLYGTAEEGGLACSCGLIFELKHTATAWQEIILYEFHGSDGFFPSGGLIFDARVAVMGVDETPRRLCEAEDVLRDASGETAVFKQFARTVRMAVSPPSDIHVSSDYRRALIGLLAERVTAAAWTRAAGGAQ